MPRHERVLLRAAIAVPVLYYATLVVASLLYPGYSHVTQYASELGASGARHPGVFNTAIVAAGLLAIAGGAGFFLALRRATHPALAALTGIAVALFGVGFVFGGLFPMPDPRHGGYGTGFAVHLAPLFLLAALWKTRTQPWLKPFLAATIVYMTAMFLVMMGVGELVTRANVGLFQRLYSLGILPWIGIAAAALLRGGVRLAPTLDVAAAAPADAAREPALV
jgi:hypothetical membrane protein